ncbi:hypothetical protein NQ038_00960 [Brevibacterium sp. 50QC2O2]|uniref:Rv3654c family TadE-like protein n=1 Tax=unclassified Brevibacterium TaxID=2614124 RepID=UPI00211C0CBF|nr:MULTISPECIES: Rv3654c family TadE-like protein [unclassified Brevibacterium]MCQ9368618.1 hypothetical protein [Brevibacterium sp. 91QC2O2]MCQ9387226.1 hypothetical protein [Brevibacterium sp. 50QC2O2]
MSGPDRRGVGSGHDRGSSTVVSIGIMLACLGLIASLGLMSRAFGAKTRADALADLVALAAADAARGRAPGEPCRVAKEMTEKRAGAKLVECIARPDLGRVTVTVQVKAPPPFPAIKSKAVAGGTLSR